MVPNDSHWGINKDFMVAGDNTFITRRLQLLDF